MLRHVFPEEVVVRAIGLLHADDSELLVEVGRTSIRVVVPLEEVRGRHVAVYGCESGAEKCG